MVEHYLNMIMFSRNSPEIWFKAFLQYIYTNVLFFRGCCIKKPSNDAKPCGASTNYLNPKPDCVNKTIIKSPAVIGRRIVTPSVMGINLDDSYNIDGFTSSEDSISAEKSLTLPDDTPIKSSADLELSDLKDLELTIDLPANDLNEPIPQSESILSPDPSEYGALLASFNKRADSRSPVSQRRTQTKDNGVVNKASVVKVDWGKDLGTPTTAGKADSGVIRENPAKGVKITDVKISSFHKEVKSTVSTKVVEKASVIKVEKDYASRRRSDAIDRKCKVLDVKNSSESRRRSDGIQNADRSPRLTRSSKSIGQSKPKIDTPNEAKKVESKAISRAPKTSKLDALCRNSKPKVDIFAEPAQVVEARRESIEITTSNLSPSLLKSSKSVGECGRSKIETEETAADEVEDFKARLARIKRNHEARISNIDKVRRSSIDEKEFKAYPSPKFRNSVSKESFQAERDAKSAQNGTAAAAAIVKEVSEDAKPDTKPSVPIIKTEASIEEVPEVRRRSAVLTKPPTHSVIETKPEVKTFEPIKFEPIVEKVEKVEKIEEVEKAPEIRRRSAVLTKPPTPDALTQSCKTADPLTKLETKKPTPTVIMTEQSTSVKNDTTGDTMKHIVAVHVPEEPQVVEQEKLRHLNEKEAALLESTLGAFKSYASQKFINSSPKVIPQFEDKKGRARSEGIRPPHMTLKLDGPRELVDRSVSAPPICISVSPGKFLKYLRITQMSFFFLFKFWHLDLAFTFKSKRVTVTSQYGKIRP